MLLQSAKRLGLFSVTEFTDFLLKMK